jgi:hypothetical protein
MKAIPKQGPAGDDDPQPTTADWPVEDADIGAWTDKYFTRTRRAVEHFGDVRVTYAVLSSPRHGWCWTG